MKIFTSAILVYFLLVVNAIEAQEKNPSSQIQDTFTYTRLGISDTQSGSLSLGVDSGNENELTNDFQDRAPDSGIGETEGVLSVSPSGGSNYDIPIAVPPGINGVAPQISISYNSQLGNGLAGFGWNINGVSAITRIPATTFHNNQIDPVDFDNLDHFALDGERLILKSGTHGVSGAIYETENYSNLKIVAHGSPSSYGGPSSFIVSYPDGSKAYYGYSGDSRSPTNYSITFWQNPQGLRISYKYLESNNSQFIHKIQYGSRLNETAINEIIFEYAEESDRGEQSFIGGTSLFKKDLLSKIEVYGNGTRYRAYSLNYNKTSLNYPRLDKVTERSGDGLENHTPIYFSYYNSVPNVNYNDVTTVGLNNIEQRNAEVVSFDLTGNGNMDFLVYPKDDKDKFWLFKDLQNGSSNTPWLTNTGAFETIFPATLLNHQDKVFPGQGLTVVQNVAATSVDFKVYSNRISNPIALQYTKNWNNPTYTHQTNPSNNITKRVPHEYVSGDFNGDGLTDVLAIGRPYSFDYCELDPDGFECFTEDVAYKGVHFIDLNRQLSSGDITYSGTLQVKLEDTDKIHAGDFNGDGKTDLLHSKYGNVYIYTIDENNNLALLWETTNAGINPDTPFLLGDFNGDGKTDFMNPSANNSSSFGVYISTGLSFENETIIQPFEYNSTIYNGNTNILTGYNLIPLDVNGDGRTDIVEYITTTYDDSSNGIQYIKEFKNLGLKNTTLPTRITFASAGSVSKTGNARHFPIPVFLTSNHPNKKLEFASISDKWITNFTFSRDHRYDVLLRKVANNGVQYKIEYSGLDPLYSHNGYNKQIYTATPFEEVYPNIDIISAPGLQVVTRLERAALSGVGVGTNPDIAPLIQLFGYEGAVFNLNGQGFQGFRGMAQSNWHPDHAQRKFNVSKYDPSLKGAKVAEYYQTFDYFFNIPTSNYISKSTFEYSSNLSSNKVFKLWMDSSLNENSLNGTFAASNYTYDTYNNPTRVVTNYMGGRTVSSTTYVNSTGSTYYIGRPTSVTEESSIGSETFTSEQQFIYSGNLVNSIKSKGNGTDFDTTDLNYDIFGNIIEQILTPAGESSREVQFSYDSSGRFMEQATSVEDLVTNYEYNVNKGILTKITSPYGQENTFGYDKWNREIWQRDYLGNETTTDYVENLYKYAVSINGDDGGFNSAQYDALGRIETITEKNVLGELVNISYEYDSSGRAYRVSEPYYENGNPSQWTETTFDLYGRPVQQTLHTGRQITMSYDMLSVTVDDGVKTVTSTQDGLGNTIRVTDPGGTINYSYYGNGAIKNVITNGSTVSTEQDGWGRKTKLIDPSAGTFEYEYNGYGELTKEISPKGQTEFIYSAIGKLEQKNTIGDLTDISSTYTYDATHKFLKSLITTSADGNNNTYNYTYDSFDRLIKIVEQNPFAEFRKEYTYDNFGRIDTEEQFAKLLANNKTSSKKIKNVFEYGALKSIQDFSTNNIIWEISELNARGQIKEASMGAGMTSNQTFDTYGYLTKTSVDTSTNRLMELSTDFDVQKGTLRSRENDMFSWSETFEYDSLDRLIAFNDNDGDNSISYDNSGRITSNPEVGDYEYSGNSFQLQNVDLNAQGDLYYQRNPLQNVTFNAFKKPVEISEEGKEKVSFQYNPFMRRSHMFYGDTEEEIAQRNNRKHYSFDGSMEISVDQNLGTTTFVTYIGGDAYSAPAIWKSKQSFSGPEEGYFYLHRDYLGSIMLITDGSGTTQEKRHFDAWGSLIKVTDGSGNSLEKLTFLDRGYTGHEHLQGVHLIHMNGRLYDPKLKRFLSPDNFIQDMGDTQNFNRYSYVLNNPLMYTDPSGEMSQESGTGGYLIAAAVVASIASSWDYISPPIYKLGRGFANLVRSIGRDIRSIFNPTERVLPVEYTNPTNLNNDPLAGSSINTPNSFFGGTGANPGGLGITAGDVLDTALDFVPIAGGVKDIYKGINDGDGWQVALGVGSIVLDVFTLGSASLIKGVVKTGIKAGTKVYAKSVAKSAARTTVQNVKKFSNIANVRRANPAKLSSNADKLRRDLKFAEEYGKGGSRVLQNGRTRYYSQARQNIGNTDSWRQVKEWDPKTNATRFWHETLDQSGRIRQVRPEFGNGIKKHYVFD